jgi:hypothetical protein
MEDEAASLLEKRVKMWIMTHDPASSFHLYIQHHFMFVDIQLHCFAFLFSWLCYFIRVLFLRREMDEWLWRASRVITGRWGSVRSLGVVSVAWHVLCLLLDIFSLCSWCVAYVNDYKTMMHHSDGVSVLRHRLTLLAAILPYWSYRVLRMAYGFGGTHF